MKKAEGVPPRCAVSTALSRVVIGNDDIGPGLLCVGGVDHVVELGVLLHVGLQPSNTPGTIRSPASRVCCSASPIRIDARPRPWNASSTSVWRKSPPAVAVDDLGEPGDGAVHRDGETVGLLGDGGGRAGLVGCHASSIPGGAQDEVMCDDGGTAAEALASTPRTAEGRR